MDQTDPMMMMMILFVRLVVMINIMFFLDNDNDDDDDCDHNFVNFLFTILKKGRTDVLNNEGNDHHHHVHDY